MSAARVLSLTVIVFFMALIGMLWTALNKVTAIQQTAKAPAEVSRRLCKRVDLSDDLELLGYDGCRIEMDFRGTKLQPGEKLLFNWGLETRQGVQADWPVRTDDSSMRPGGGTEIARGGHDRSAPGKVELAVIYRRTPKADGALPFTDGLSGHQRIRLDGRPLTAGEFSAEVRGGSVEIIPFRFKEFPLNEPFTMLEYVFAPVGKDGQKVIEEQVVLRWLAKITIASN